MIPSSYRLCPRVCLVVDRFQTGVTDACVDLGRRESGMAEKFLDAPKVCTAVEQVRGKTVPETVRTYFSYSGHLFQPSF